HGQRDDEWLTVRKRGSLDCDIGNIEIVIMRDLIARAGNFLIEVSFRVHKAHGRKIEWHIARGLGLIARKNSQAPGIDRKASMKPIFRGEISDRWGGGLRLGFFSFRWMRAQIFFERPDKRIVLFKEGGIFRETFEPDYDRWNARAAPRSSEIKRGLPETNSTKDCAKVLRVEKGVLEALLNNVFARKRNNGI